MAQYKIGDRVRIVREWNNECHQNPEGLMDRWLGAIMTIKSWNGVSYQMEEDVGERGENYSWNWYPAAIAGLADAAENNEELLDEAEYNVGDQVRIVDEFKDMGAWESRGRKCWLGKVMIIDKKIVIHTIEGIKYIYRMVEDSGCWNWESEDIAGIEKESFVQGAYYESENRVKVVSEWINMTNHPNGLLGQVVTILKRYIDFNAKGARWAYYIKEDFSETTWFSDDFVGLVSPRRPAEAHSGFLSLMSLAALFQSKTIISFPRLASPLANAAQVFISFPPISSIFPISRLQDRRVVCRPTRQV